MSDIPAMPYSLLWGERVVRSVANLTRADAEQFLALAGRDADRHARCPVRFGRRP
jgi:propanol-preferring alcohol dehydrogenase